MGRIIVRSPSIISPSSLIAGAGSGWVQTFFDDFNGAANDPPNPLFWNNPEDDNDYPAQDAKFLAANAYQNGSGSLIIEAKRQSSGGASYTSGQISTRGIFEQAGGRFEARIKMPAGGSGYWPAYWLLGPNWPHGGEQDILEAFADTSTAYGFYHWYSGGHQQTGGVNASGLSSGFHIYAVEWDPGVEIRWYIDGVKVRTFTDSAVVSNAMWIMIDTYIGGTAGDPSGTTFPQQLEVDYVAAYQRA